MKKKIENSSLFFFHALRARSRALASLASSPMFSKRTKRKIKQRLCTGYRHNKATCKRMQQLPTMLRPAVQRRKNTTNETLSVNHVSGPNNVGSAVQLDPTLLRYPSAITEQKKC